MTTDRIRAFQKLDFRDPRSFLVGLSRLEPEVASSDMPEKVKKLRTNQLKPLRELRTAALFCYGMSEKIGSLVYVASTEKQDHDFVATFGREDTKHYVPVQLKEVVPPDLNDSATLQGVVDSLSKKYVDSSDLTVVIHLNRQVRFDPEELNMANLGVGSLWVLGAIAPNNRQFAIWGDLMTTREGFRFSYPS
jgi:hypothetical protein